MIKVASLLALQCSVFEVGVFYGGGGIKYARTLIVYDIVYQAALLFLKIFKARKMMKTRGCSARLVSNVLFFF